MREVKLNTSLDTFERLHAAASGRKTLVPVDREYLAQILTDHTALVNACSAAGIKIIEPARERPRLR